VAELELDGRTVTLIDTPGFDDAYRSDADILAHIAKWLRTTYNEGMLLTGIILLQPITANKGYRSEARQTRLYRNICGPQAFENTVIATTMWSELRDKNDGYIRVQQRTESPEFWAEMVDQGARVINHNNTSESAHKILRSLMKRHKVTLQMQRELSDNNGNLYKTTAARQLDEDLGEKLNQLHEQLSNMRADRHQLTEEVNRLKTKLVKVEEERTTLNKQVSLETPYLFICTAKTEPRQVTTESSPSEMMIGFAAVAGAMYPYFCTVV
jgi:polyhydroxyalkanoate synthesis regulator phasin